MIVSIVVGSTVKGLVTGAPAGLIARRWRSMIGGILFGLGLAILKLQRRTGACMSGQRNVVGHP